MSRVGKWKIEKAKVKVVFRLQFHATNISLIPTETGKATAKTNKANVRYDSCRWADPIYETTRLLLDSKTKQYDDKLYKLVVGMGRLDVALRLQTNRTVRVHLLKKYICSRTVDEHLPKEIICSCLFVH
ncbi:hypothetical protein Hanom_Chr00s050024g01779561 [Helianthus anomalus]